MRFFRFTITIASLLLCNNAFAIPSPDLVINLTASLAQVLGMVSVLVGGLFMSGKQRGRAKTPSNSGGNRWLVTGVLVTLLLSVCINFWQYARQSDFRTQQLNVNLHRKATENGKELGGVSLKTLSFSDQTTHSRGIETQALAALLGDDSATDGKSTVVLIDVREDEEVEAGRIPGATHIRYPDLLKNPELLDGVSNAVLLCYSGNRSSELTGELQSRGIETKFMVGGYEKWMSEGRLLDVKSKDKKSLREIPQYTNRDKLLETEEVHDLVNNQEAVFVDVRYPSEFNNGHLPGAINLTIRAEPSQSLQEKLATIPDKPIIGVCYDRRSCFYAKILGLKLSRLGIGFAGRYTVPQEYIPPKNSAGKQHVADWNDRNQASLVGLASLKIGNLLTSLVERFGNAFFVLAALVLLVRLPLLPLFIKMERDRLVQKRLAPVVQHTKRRFSNDRAARGPAIQKLYRQHNIKPVLTLAGSLLNLVVLLFLFNVVNDHSHTWETPLWWVDAAGAPDESHMTGFIIAVLVIALSYASNRPMTKIKVALIGLGSLAIALLVLPMSMAVNVYLVISLAVVLLQMGLVSLIDRRLGWSGSQQQNTEEGLTVPLCAAHYSAEKTGRKAARLGELIEDGFNVPDGFVVPLSNIQQIAAGDNQTTAELAKAWSSIRAAKVAVRSSGIAEDGDKASFAGVYDSILNVEKSTLAESLRKVAESLAQGLKTEYAQNHLDHETQSGGGVLVQRMVPAEYAGVVFTEHPETAGKMLVEMVEGLGESLVSGAVSPETYSAGRRSLSLDREAPFDLSELLNLAIAIETRYGKPQDIEWAYSGGKIYILQARDITSTVTKRGSLKGVIEFERARALQQLNVSASDEPVLRQNELSELLPRPTPVSASMIEKLWAVNGSTDLACQRLGLPYDVTAESRPYVNVYLGWLYVNKDEEFKRTKKGAGAIASFKLSRNADAIADQFEQDFLPNFKRRMDLQRAVDFNRLSTDKLIDAINYYTNRFVTDTYVEAEVINICNQFYWNTASAKLQSHGLDPNQFLGKLPENVVSTAMNMLAQSDTNPSMIDEYREFYGHRAPLDYELANPRYCEDQSLIDQQASALAGNHAPAATDAEVPLNNRMLQIAVERVRRFQALKEEAKHQCLREYFLIRRALVALGKKCDFDTDIFYLSIDEISELKDKQYRPVARQLAGIRRRRSELFKDFNPPAQLTLTDLENYEPMSNESTSPAERKDQLSGTRISGQESVSGVVHVIRDESELDKFREGEILVARMTDPSWYALFPLAKGIITEVGGWLSHAAIVAREYDLPAVVGVEDATSQLRSGDIVQINVDGTIERLSERRAPDSPMRVSVPAAVAARELADTILTDEKVVPLPVKNADAEPDNAEPPRKQSGE